GAREGQTLRVHTGVVGTVAFGPDGARLASASEGVVKVWDLADGRELLTLKGHTGWATELAFSPDGRRLASTSSDGTVRVWDLADGRELHTLKGHTGVVYGLAFSPDGRRLASGGMDGAVKLWDLDGGQEILTLKGHAAMVVHLAFSPDGDRLASASQDGEVKVWDARPLSEEVRREAEVWSEVYRRLAEDALRQGQWAEAVRHLDRRITAGAASWRDHRARGRARAELGLWDEAAADYTKVLEQVPDIPHPASDRSQVCAELVRWEEVFARVVALRPQDMGPLVARGRAHALRREWAEAAADYARAIEARPLPAQGQPHDEPFEYACLLLLVGDQAGYRELSRRLADRVGAEPDPFACYVLARTCGLAAEPPADPAQLVRWAERAVASSPRTAWYLHTLGLAHSRAGQGQEAVRRLEESDGASWGDASVVNWLALVLTHHRLGHGDEARRWLEKATGWLDKAPPGSLPASDWLEAHVLVREAKARLTGPVPAPGQ
ncbi:MAG TPA: tetratricopeptide repeat protein, partial [Gemmataceae bacterium]|nr:tetratricopeptide repeat protein [Gemmataceae bacterium]